MADWMQRNFPIVLNLKFKCLVRLIGSAVFYDIRILKRARIHSNTQTGKDREVQWDTKRHKYSHNAETKREKEILW